MQISGLDRKTTNKITKTIERRKLSHAQATFKELNMEMMQFYPPVRFQILQNSFNDDNWNSSQM